MTGMIDARDWYQCAQKPGVYRRGGGATGIEMEREEADGDVKHLAGNFMTVDKGAPVSVYRNEAEGGWGAREVAPVGRAWRGGGRGGEVAVGGRC